MFRSPHVRTAVGLVLALSWLSKAIPAASDPQTKESAEPFGDKGISLKVGPVSVSTLLKTLFNAADVQCVIDKCITGTTTINVAAAPFDAALLSILNGSDPRLTCSVKDGVYSVTVADTTPPETTAPFTYTSPDGSFRAEATKIHDPAPRPGYSGFAHDNFSLDGTVVVRTLLPHKTLTISPGKSWINLLPVCPMLFDTASETTEVTDGVITLRDKTGRSLTIYPYSEKAK